MLFQPDKFSETGPHWNTIEKLDDFLLGVYWAQVEAKIYELVGAVQVVSAINGLEVNSKNYLIKGTNALVIVKIVERSKYIELDTSMAINSEILMHNIPAAKLSRIQPLQMNRHIILFYDYFSGAYFDGSPQDISSVIKSINVLHNGFSDAKIPFIKPMEPYPNESNEILESALHSRSDFGIFLREKTPLCKNLDTFYAILENCNEFKNQLHQFKKSIFHIDLHPHNILVLGEENLILDLDSLRKVEWPIPLGYCFFKLLRQVYVSSSYKGQNNLEFYMEQIYKELDTIVGEKEKNLMNFLNGANYEIMRRLLLILNEYTVYGHSKWNAVLSVQIDSLLEINQIRGSL